MVDRVQAVIEADEWNYLNSKFVRLKWCIWVWQVTCVCSGSILRGHTASGKEAHHDSPYLHPLTTGEF